MKNVRRLLLILSAAALGWAALVAATGGFQWRAAGLVVRSTGPGRALAIGLVLLLTYAIVFRDSFLRDTDRVATVLRRVLPGLAICSALALGAHAVRYGTFTAGGSDAFAYVNQAYGWASETLPRAEPLPISVPWPAGDSSLAPLGYRPGPQPHTIVPSYAPGLPLLMAACGMTPGGRPCVFVPRSLSRP